MELSDLRNKIDDIDDNILDLFVERMNICRDIAEYKLENKLPVMQGNREEQILNRVRERSPADLADGSAELFSEKQSFQREVRVKGFALKCLRSDMLLKTTRNLRKVLVFAWTILPQQHLQRQDEMSHEKTNHSQYNL